MKLNGDTFTVSPSSNVKDVKINGAAVSNNSLKITEAKDYTLTGLATFSNNETNDKLKVTYTVTKTTTDPKGRLKDKAGHELFMDKEGKTPALNENYTAGTKYYYNDPKITYYGWQTLNGVTYYFDKNGNKVTGTQVISGMQYPFNSEGALVVSSGVGIDVSKFQGAIDWSQVKGAVNYAMIRCGGRYRESRGLYEDPYFYKNMSGAKSAGVAVGVYFYSTATNEAQAVEEASLAVAMTNNAGGCSLPIYIDMEDSIQAGLSNDERTNIINAFCATVANSGYRTGVYANYTWLTKKINTGSIPSNYSIWIARYNDTLGYSGRYDYWQYTSKGRVPGISGNVDMNRTH